MMQICFVHLHWTPQTFWRTTPRELAQVLNGLFPNTSINPLNAHDLAQLMAKFPD
jgi:uncharacterized phage protein (TIGR02216 family)